MIVPPEWLYTNNDVVSALEFNSKLPLLNFTAKVPICFYKQQATITKFQLLGILTVGKSVYFKIVILLLYKDPQSD
jgi:hypothetical protein